VATIRVFDVDTPWTNLTLTAASSNTAIASVVISATNASTQTNILVGTNAVNFTLALTPVSNVVGSTTIQLVASDGQKSTTNKFKLTVSAVDQAPSYRLSTNLVLAAENAGAITLSDFLTAVSPGPTNESSQNLTFTVLTSTNNSTNVTFAAFPKVVQQGTNADLMFTTATNAYGTNTLTVILRDGGSTNNGGINSFTNSFTLGVAWVDQAPHVGSNTNRTILENVSTNVAIIRVFDVDTAWTNLTLTASPSNSSLVSIAITATNASTQTNLLVGTNAVDFSLALTPATNAVGSTLVTLLASDGQKTTTNNFTLTVATVNQVPSFRLAVGTITVNQYGVVTTIPNAVTNVSAGPTNEHTQTVSFIVSNSTPSLFLIQPAIDANGTLTFTPDATAGTVTVTAYAHDNGGTANGGVDTSAGQTFSIVIPANPFTTLGGTFAGLFFETNVLASDSSGYFQMTLATNGGFAGYFLRPGASNQFSGRFGVTNAVATVTSTPCVLNLSLDTSTNDTESVSGWVTNSSTGWSAPLLGFLNPYASGSPPSPFAAEYLLAIPGDSDATAGPAGDSILSLTVSNAGTLSFGGYLSDNSLVPSQDSQISRDGHFPLYIRQGTTVSMSGWLTFTTNGSSHLTSDSSVVWIKRAGGTFYPGGFTNSSVALASAYDSSAPDLLAITNGRVVLRGGNLASSITNAVTITNNVITVDPSATNGLALSMDAASGQIQGHFIAPGNHTNAIYSVILQATNVARGYFMGTNQGGAFILIGN
jgi:hypothetical protein